jgi:hypothetical protein
MYGYMNGKLFDVILLRPSKRKSVCLHFNSLKTYRTKETIELTTTLN